MLDPAPLSKGKHTVVVRALGSSGSVDKTFTILVARPRPPIADILAAMRGLAGGEWYAIPETQVADIVYNPPGDFRGGSESIFSQSGGAYDTKRNRLFVWGGGGDSFHNEIYVFDFITATWLRLNDPSPWPLGGEGNLAGDVVHPDGAPISRHSFDCLQYIESLDRLYLGGGRVPVAGGGTVTDDKNTYLFDFDTLTWTIGLEIDTIGFGAVSAVGPDDRIWQHGPVDPPSGRLSAVDNQAQSVSYHAGWPVQFPLNFTAEIDPAGNHMYIVGNGHTYRWNLDDPDSPAVDLLTTGATEIQNAVGAGLVYHPVKGVLVAWSGTRDVYTLDLTTLVWTKVTGSGGNPGAANAGGTFGRFRYIPDEDLFILVNTAGTNVHVYRLP
jgi:hypothetical protein